MGKTRRREAHKSGAPHRKRDDSPEPPKAGRTQKSGKVGRKGRSAWAPELETELAQIGLRVHEVAADGSCFFRSLADQLEGSAGDHRALRKQIISHIAGNRDLFEPFVEDDEPFDDYIERMGEEGTWAGHMEVQAASMSLKVNLRLYQAGTPTWTVANFPLESSRMLHLSYHDGIHYNSVRLADDYGSGPPAPIPIHGFAGGGGGASLPVAVEGFKGSYEMNILKRIKDGTGCEDDDRIVEALDKFGGDVDAAIEALIESIHGNNEEEEEKGDAMAAAVAEQRAEKVESTAVEKHLEALANSESLLSCSGAIEEEAEERLVSVELAVSRGGKGRRIALLLHWPGYPSEISSQIENSTEHENLKGKEKKRKGGNDKKKENQPLGRNARCHCGSSKKYKNCCGASKTASKTRAGIKHQYEKEGATTAQVDAAFQTLYI